MTKLFWTLLILLLLIIFIIINNIINLYQLNTEHWQDYMTSPFDFIGTGSNPINFYRKDLYREPYEYPYRFFSSYPVPSVQYHTLL